MTPRVNLIAAILTGVTLFQPAVPAAAERGAGISPLAAEPAGPDDEIRFAGGTIKVDFDDDAFAVGRADALQWVLKSARAATAYFGRFPVKHARIRFEPTRGSMVTMGRAGGRPAPHIIVTMGRGTTAAKLRHETLLVHEMVHLGVPDHDLRHLWLHEGIATYVEFVASAQVGLLPPAAVWAEFVREMPDGLPGGRDRGGLDGARSESRQYWGGAVFCLIADIELRKATGNRYGLQDALRAMQREGGNLSRMWSMERTFEVADAGTRTTVLSDLYRTMGRRAYAPDLATLWRNLGIRTEGRRVVLSDDAPLAHLRRAITGEPSPPLLVAEPRPVSKMGTATISR